jgi:hypothetical protein
MYLLKTVGRLVVCKPWVTLPSFLQVLEAVGSGDPDRKAVATPDPDIRL